MCFEDAALCLFFAKEDIRCAREAEEVYSASVERIVTKSRYYNSNTTAAIDKKDNTTESNVGITWSSQFKNMLLRHTTFEVSWFCWTISVRRLTGLLLTLWLGVLSYPVVQNILSPHQVSVGNEFPHLFSCRCLMHQHRSFSPLTHTRST